VGAKYPMIRWFLMTRLGRWVSVAATFAVTLLVAFTRGMRRGRQAAEQEQTRRRVEAMREAMEVRDDVQSRSNSDVRDDLSRWMRDADD
jgi:hypothetical protein